ncbi:MAG: NosD domain-containing protein [Candidatus Aenigmatarchaeota archaeon]
MKINTLENNKSPPLIALGTAFILFLFVIQGAKAVTYISHCEVILDEDGETYYLIEDIRGYDVRIPCIIINAYNITLDCQGHRIEGIGLGYGIRIDEGGNIIIRNCIITNFRYGIYLRYSSNNTITNNTINYNYNGIYLRYSSNNSIIFNNFLNNTENIYFEGTALNHWNTTKTLGRNIVGGYYLGGNFWANPYGTGYSETCDDNDIDGICDEPYILAENNIDYLPLTMPPLLPPQPLPPQITLNIPENNSKLYTQDISFSFIAIDDSANILECSIYLDGLLNETNSSVLNNTLTNFLIKGISYGEHSWFINCSDGEVSNTSEVRYFTVVYVPKISRLSDLGLGGIMGALIIIVMFSLVPFFVLRDYLLNPEISFSGMIKILLAIVVVIAFIIVFAGITGWL